MIVKSSMVTSHILILKARWLLAIVSSTCLSLLGLGWYLLKCYRPSINHLMRFAFVSLLVIAMRIFTSNPQFFLYFYKSNVSIVPLVTPLITWRNFKLIPTKIWYFFSLFDIFNLESWKNSLPRLLWGYSPRPSPSPSFFSVSFSSWECAQRGRWLAPNTFFSPK